MYQLDLFCRVIDNWGDAGVCWRLARQLVTEHGIDVRLVIDDLAPLRVIAADALTDTESDQPRSAIPGLTVTPWHLLACASTALPAPAPVVIEAFACDPPATYVGAMAAAARKGAAPVWINLEYLSAESWVDGVHALPSPHPRLPLVKHFFVPGFSSTSGGLLREATITPLPDEPHRDDGSAAPPQFFAFTYPAAPVAELAAALGATVTLAAPLDAAPVRSIPFDPVPQTAFDSVLAGHDLLLVRGEDSFLRAQYVGRPLLWHIYPTVDGAHQIKLDAWLDRYCQGLEPRAAELYRAVSHWFIAPEGRRPDLARFADTLPALAAHARRWQRVLCAQTDLAQRLVRFIDSKR